MGDRKTINLNPEFFALSSGSRSKKTKPQNVNVNTAVQEKLIGKVQEFQRKRERNLLKTPPKPKTTNVELKPNLNRSMPHPKERIESDFQTEFDKSLHFLQQLSQKQKKQGVPSHNSTLKRGKIEQRVHLEVATDLPPELQPNFSKPNKTALTLAMPQQASAKPPVAKTQVTLTPAYAPPKPSTVPTATSLSVPTATSLTVPTSTSLSVPTSTSLSVPTATSLPVPTATSVVRPDAPFGILKNGTKPTFRAFHGITYKHRPSAPVLSAAPAPASTLTSRQAALQAAKTAFQQQKKVKPKPVLRKRVTRTVKFLLGKHNNRTVSVLVGHAEHKNRVQKERMLLRDTPISDVKAYLRKHNLIKAGSIMPQDVLRAMYENALLAGDLRNMTQQTRLHNFLHDD
jgi:hypothetical protein